MSIKKPTPPSLRRSLPPRPSLRRSLPPSDQTPFQVLLHVHGRLIRLGLDQDNYLLNLILKSCFNRSTNTTHYTQLIFRHTHQPKFYLYNTMIRGLVSHDHFDQSIELYHSMRKQGFLPNHFTFPFVLKACALLSNYQLGVELHNLVVKAGLVCNVFVKTGLVCMYAQCGYLESARKVFDEIPEKNVVSCTALISGYIDGGLFGEAVGVFVELLEMGLRPDSYMFVRVFSAVSRLGDLGTGEERKASTVGKVGELGFKELGFMFFGRKWT